MMLYKITLLCMSFLKELNFTSSSLLVTFILWAYFCRAVFFSISHVEA